MEFKLSDLLNIKYGKSQKRVENPDGKYPIIGTGGIMGFSSEYLYDKPSVLIGRKGSIQNIYFIDKPFWTIDTLFYTEINKEIVNPKFIYYKLKNIDMTQFDEGTSVPSLRTATLNEIILDIPSKTIQFKTVQVLNSMDKKIEINKKIIENLEDQAQAIFKSWFVDFEPFQDRNFVESELGLIPEDWIVKNIGDISKVKSGKRPNKKSDTGLFPIYGANGITGWTDEFLLNEPAIITGRVGTLGKLYRLNNEVWPSDNTLVFTSDDYELLYYNLRSIDYKSFNRGSTQPLISQRDIKNVKIVYPAEQELKKFSNIVGDIFDYINSIEKQNQTLAQTRDTLLPKLMSGEIDVSNIKIDEDIDYD